MHSTFGLTSNSYITFIWPVTGGCPEPTIETLKKKEKERKTTLRCNMPIALVFIPDIRCMFCILQIADFLFFLRTLQDSNVLL